MTGNDDIIATAAFDPKLRLYLFITAASLGIVTVVGALLLPFTLWLAWWWSGHYYEALRCDLTTRRLRYAFGILFRTEKTIPLDRIQDLTLVRGPILNWLGLCKLRVETAGGGSSSNGFDSGAATLTGVVDALAFQELVMRERDRVADRAAPAPAPAPALMADGDPTTLLREIAATLGRIEKRLPAAPETNP